MALEEEDDGGLAAAAQEWLKWVTRVSLVLCVKGIGC